MLVVDDDPRVLASTAELLAHLGFRVATCERADGVLDALLHEPPDVLLQDVRMPGLDVAKLVARIRAQPELARVRIVLFSAAHDLDELAARIQPDAVLEKPFAAEALLRAVSHERATATASMASRWPEGREPWTVERAGSVGKTSR